MVMFVQQLPELHCGEPIDEEYLQPDNTLDQLQEFAFNLRIDSLTLSGPQKKGWMRSGCVHNERLEKLLYSSDAPTGMYNKIYLNEDKDLHNTEETDNHISKRE